MRPVKKVLPLLNARNDSVNQSGSRQDDKRISPSGNILKFEPIEFSGGLDMDVKNFGPEEFERKLFIY